MAKKRLGRDQKRKAKLARRARKNPPTESLAYHGDTYKTDELTPVFLSTETAIYEMFVMTDRQLTDRHVKEALEQMVLRLRAGTLPAWGDDEKLRHEEGKEPELIVQNVRRHWRERFLTFPHPGTQTLVGILRTLLASIETWSSPSPNSRGYLNFLEGFLRKGGVRVQKVSPDALEPAEEAEDPFLELGYAWCEGDDLNAKTRFMQQAEELISSGQADRVVDAAQHLIGVVGTGPQMPELAALSLRAQQTLRPGSP
jgi:hypothetical protein